MGRERGEGGGFGAGGGGEGGLGGGAGGKGGGGEGGSGGEGGGSVHEGTCSCIGFPAGRPGDAMAKRLVVLAAQVKGLVP